MNYSSHPRCIDVKVSTPKTAWRTVPGAFLAALLLALPATAPAQLNTWTGDGTTDNWSDTANWIYGMTPQTYDVVLFDNAEPGVANAVIDNIVDASFTITGIQYQSAATNGYHTTLIPAGVALRLDGGGGDAISIGTGVPQGGQNVYYRVVGGGTMSVTNTAGMIKVVQGGSDADHFAVLDLGGLTNFIADVDQIVVAGITDTTGGTRPMGRIVLAETNYLHTAAGTTKPGIIVAAHETGDTNRRGTQDMQLGRHNVMHSDAITVGGHKLVAVMQPRSGVTSGLVTLRGSGGGADPVKVLTLGDQLAGVTTYARPGSSVSPSGTFNTTRLLLDALVTDTYVGRSATTSSGTGSGTLTFDTGTYTTDQLYLGYHADTMAASITANATGVVNVNGTGTLNVNGDVLLARKLGSSTPTATINIAPEATMNVKGNINSGGGTSTLNVNGVLNLQPAGDATPGNIAVSTLSGAGSIIKAASVQVNTSLTPGGGVAAATLAVEGNLTLAANAGLVLNLSSSAAGANDRISVTGNLVLNDNTVTLVPIEGTLDTSGSYRLFEFTGTRTGQLNFVNATRYEIVITYGANFVDLTVTGGAPASLKWNSVASATWDVTASNWLNGAESDRFQTLDAVRVDDSVAATNLLLLAGTLYPGQVTVDSSTRDYVFGGSGLMSGGASLVKEGSAMLTISNANSFLGPVNVNAGVLRTVNAAALGATNSGTTVANGATLDVFGQSLYNPGELITIAGTGLNNTGAVINTGANQNNALRYLALTADSRAGSYSRFDVRGPGGSGSFSGKLDLGGFTLTKAGPAQMSIVDSIATNAGTLHIEQGVVGITRSQVDGPGSIYVYTNTLYIENSVTGYLAKPIVLDGGTLRATGNGFTLWSPITNISGGTIDNTVTLTLTNVVYGPGPLTKVNTGNLVFEAAQAYTGPTRFAAGRVTIGANGALASTPELEVVGGATLDVSALAGGFVVAPGQTLSGSGTVEGSATVGAGSILAPGATGPGTLTITNDLSLNNAVSVFQLGSDPTIIGGNANDLAAVGANLNLSGMNTIQVAPLAALNNAQPYTLFQYGNSLVGGLGNLKVESDSRYSFTVIDPATTPNSIQVNVSGSGASADLVWKGEAAVNPTFWDTKTTANWLNGASADVFYLGDNVTFNDTATTPTVDLVGTAQPAAVTFNNATLNYTLGGAGDLLAGSVVKNGAGSLTFNGSGTHTFSAGATVNAGAVNLLNEGGNVFASGATINGGLLRLANTGANLFSQPIAVNGGSLVIDLAADTAFSAVLTDNGSGTGLVEKRNDNVLTVTANNTNYNGAIRVSAGTLKVGQTYALGNINGLTTVANGATLDLAGIAINNPGDEINIIGNGVNDLGAIINTGGEQQNGIRAVSLSGNAAIGSWGSRYDIRGPGGNGSFSGLLNLGGFRLSKLGPGRVSAVDADMTSNGTIDIVEGMLALTRANVGGSGAINVSTNLLVLENFTAGSVSKALTFNGGTLRLVGNALAVDSPIALSGPGAIMETAVQMILGGVVSGNGGLTKIGTAQLVLNGMNTFSGPIMVNAGILQFGMAEAAGTSGSVTILNTTGTTGGSGAVVEVGSGVMMPDNVALTVHTTYSPDIRGSLRGMGYGSTWQGPVIPMDDGRVGFYSENSTELIVTGPVTNRNFAGVLFIRGGSGGQGRLAGPVDLGTGRLFKTDAGLWAIASKDNKWSQTTVAVGTVRLETNDALCVTAPLVFGQNGVNNATLDLNGFNQTVPSLGNTGTGAHLIGNDSFYTDSVFTYAGGTNVSSFSGQFMDTIVAFTPQKLSLTLASGMLNLNGSNTFTGPTLVQNSSTLGGTGSLISQVTVQNGGTLAPGSSALGTLTISNNLVLASGSTTVMDLNPGTLTSDRVAGLSNVVYAGTLVLTNGSAANYAVGNSFKLFEAETYSGSFTAVQPATPGSGMDWDLSSLAVDGTLKIKEGAVLEGTNLTFTVSGNVLEMSWPLDYTGWRLEGQTNSLSVGLSDNWGTVPGSATTNRVFLPIDPANGTVFYRLIYP